jgi:hypothetical protein
LGALPTGPRKSSWKAYFTAGRLWPPESCGKTTAPVPATVTPAIMDMKVLRCRAEGEAHNDHYR